MKLILFFFGLFFTKVIRLEQSRDISVDNACVRGKKGETCHGLEGRHFSFTGGGRGYNVDRLPRGSQNIKKTKSCVQKHKKSLPPRPPAPPRPPK